MIGTEVFSTLGFRGHFIQKLPSEGHEVFAFAIYYIEDQKQTLISWGGVLVVASPVGVKCGIMQEGKNGMLANSPQDWHKAFRESLNKFSRTPVNMR